MEDRDFIEKVFETKSYCKKVLILSWMTHFKTCMCLKFEKIICGNGFKKQNKMSCLDMS